MKKDKEILFQFTLMSQMPGGKNAQMIDPRSYGKYAGKRFEGWREVSSGHIYKAEQLRHIKRHTVIISKGEPGVMAKERDVVFSGPVRIESCYWPGDLKTRDVAGMEDAIGHLLEHTGVMSNDGLIEDWNFHRMPLDREHPRIEIEIRSKGLTT